MITDRRQFILDNTRLQRPPHTPELVLHLADEVTPIWRLTEEALEEIGLPPPFWAFAWAGARLWRATCWTVPRSWRPAVVDFASARGSWASPRRAGAARVLAADIDPFCGAALALNAAANGVAVDFTDADLLDVPPPAWAQVILAGDICYEKPLADRVMAWLGAARDAGATVLIGDPGRSYFPREGLTKLAEYQVPTTRELEDLEVKKTAVWTLP